MIAAFVAVLVAKVALRRFLRARQRAPAALPGRSSESEGGGHGLEPAETDAASAEPGSSALLGPELHWAVQLVLQRLPGVNYDLRRTKLEQLHVLLETIFPDMSSRTTAEWSPRVLILVEREEFATKLQDMLRICWKTGLVHECQGLHGLESDLRDFAEGRVQILICTGAASRRRLDFQASHVVIFELPSDIDTFVYLVGRAGTGHCAARGVAYLFVHEHPAHVYFCSEVLRHWEDAGMAAPPAVVDFVAAPRAMPQAEQPLACVEELQMDGVDWSCNGEFAWSLRINGDELAKFEFRAKQVLRSTFGLGGWRFCRVWDEEAQRKITTLRVRLNGVNMHLDRYENGDSSAITFRVLKGSSRHPSERDDNPLGYDPAAAFFSRVHFVGTSLQNSHEEEYFALPSTLHLSGEAPDSVAPPVGPLLPWDLDRSIPCPPPRFAPRTQDDPSQASSVGDARSDAVASDLSARTGASRRGSNPPTPPRRGDPGFRTTARFYAREERNRVRNMIEADQLE